MLSRGENAAADQLKQNFLDEVNSIKDAIGSPTDAAVEALIDNLMNL